MSVVEVWGAAVVMCYRRVRALNRFAFVLSLLPSVNV